MLCLVFKDVVFNSMVLLIVVGYAISEGVLATKRKEDVNPKVISNYKEGRK